MKITTYFFLFIFQNVPVTSTPTAYTLQFNGTTGNDVSLTLTPAEQGQSVELTDISIEACYTPGKFSYIFFGGGGGSRYGLIKNLFLFVSNVFEKRINIYHFRKYLSTYMRV